jgi:hypothetical protein
MRADMAKILVERPRPGSKYGTMPANGYRKRQNRSLADPDGQPNRERMIEPYGWNLRHFNENLAPLRRYLQSQVGRPWDKVYAEICAHIDRGNVVQKHILTHLFDYVVRRVVLIDKVPCFGEGGLYGRPILSGYRDQWYVCPKTGLLRTSPKRPRFVRPKPVAPLIFVVSPSHLVRKVGDLWELLTVNRLPSEPGRCFSQERDLLTDRPIRGTPDSVFVAEYGRRVYTIARRPLTKKELLRLPIPIDLLR